MSRGPLRSRVLPWLLAVLYGASMGVEGVHALAEALGPPVASATDLCSPGGDLEALGAAGHDAGSCALCAMASQAATVASPAGLAREVAATPAADPIPASRPSRDVLTPAHPRAPPRAG